MIKSQTEERNFTLDVLRIVAAWAVVLLHASDNFVVNGHRETMEFMIGNFFNSVSRFAVPFFVMISGYLVLDENKQFSMKKHMYKVLKLFLLLLFWSAFYALLYMRDNFLVNFLFGHYHLWYMYMIIGLYLITPILRLFVNVKNKLYVYYLLGLCFVFAFVPNIIDTLSEPPTTVKKYFSLYDVPVCGFMFYYLVGWVFRVNGIGKNIGNSLVMANCVFIAIAGMSLIFLGTQFVYYKMYPSYKIFYESLNLPVLLYSLALFVALYNYIELFSSRVSSRIKSFVAKCSNLCLGVYLIHICMLHFAGIIFKFEGQTVLQILYHWFATTISSFLVVYILSKIKYLRNLVKF